MDRTEIIERLKNIAGHAVHTVGERPFIMSLDDGIAVHEAIILLEQTRWIPVSERLPSCEQEVLICTKVKPVGKDAYIDSIITPAIYEDGTMTENDSAWRWEEVDWAGWDEEEDCGIIPEGWWENRHFNPEGAFNCPVDREVVAWMPLPQPYKEG